MSARLSPADISTDPRSLAWVAQGKCPCRDGQVPDSAPCGLPIDPASLVFMCTGHDQVFQKIWPDRYEALTGVPAIDPYGEATSEKADAIEAYLAFRQRQTR